MGRVENRLVSNYTVEVWATSNPSDLKDARRVAGFWSKMPGVSQ